MKKRYKYTTAKQWGGDDGYCWAVFVKGQDMPVVDGLTRREVSYYRDKIEKQEERKHEKAVKKSHTEENMAGGLSKPQ